MLTEPGAFIQQQEESPDGGHPVPDESHSHPVPDTDNHTQPHEVRTEANIQCVLMHLHVCP